MRTETLFAATLRYLAGASYIDLVDLYHIPKTDCHASLTAIDKILQNLYLPQSEEEWRLVAIEWEWKLKKKFQMYDTCLMKGTTPAVDGIII